MKPQKALRSSLTTTLMIALSLSPLNSSEMVTEIKKTNISTHLRMTANGTSNQKSQQDFNSHEGQRTEQKQNHSENIKSDKKHSEEEKHNNHVYNYDWVNCRKKWYASLIRCCIKIFVAISFISVLLCGFMSIIH